MISSSRDFKFVFFTLEIGINAKYLSLYFQESIQYIQDNHWVERSFQRLNPVDFKVNKQYQTLKQIALDYIQKRSAV